MTETNKNQQFTQCMLNSIKDSIETYIDLEIEPFVKAQVNEKISKIKAYAVANLQFEIEKYFDEFSNEIILKIKRKTKQEKEDE